jgi:hypothetical protein
MKTKRLYLGLAFVISIMCNGRTYAQPASPPPFVCQERLDEEFARAGLKDFLHAAREFETTSEAIDASAFVKNEVGQYPAYLLVNDAASKVLVGDLIFSQNGQELAPADRVISMKDHGEAKVVLFVKAQRLVGYSSNLLNEGTGKAVLLNEKCEPQSVNLTLPPISPPYMTPVINLNPIECAHLFALEYTAKAVEVREHETLFDGLCRLRGGRVEPEQHSIDDDIVCQCPTGRLIMPELEHWSESMDTCLSSPTRSNADEFASMISHKGSLSNGGFQALVSQLKHPNSVFAQQCKILGLGSDR